MRLPARAALAALTLLALTACEDKPEERAQAAGEILPGTASDAMIATDQVQSEAPIAPRAASSGETPKDKPRATRTANPAVNEPAVAPTPEASVSPAPAPAPAAT